MAKIIKDLDILKNFIHYDKYYHGKKIVFGNGCFEILHVGHIRFFKEAKKLGNALIIAINSDEMLLKLGKRKKIIVPEDERLEILSSIEYIDYLTVMNDLTSDNLLKILKPHINVKGPDYTQDTVLEKETIESYGGKTIIVCNDEEKKHSTTNLILKFKEIEDLNFKCPMKRKRITYENYSK